MKTYKINSGTWNNREKTNAVLFINEMEDGKMINQFYFGLDKNDSAPLTKLFFEQIENGEAALEDSAYLRRLNGELPLLPGTRIIGGEIVSTENEKVKMRAKVNKRLDELYSGHVQARAERDSVYGNNRKRAIENLLAVEENPDFPYVDLAEIEDL